MSGLDGTIGTCSNKGCNATVWISPATRAEVHTSNKPCPVTGQWATIPPLDKARAGTR